MGKILKEDNFLTLIPVRNPEQKWQSDSEGQIQMIIPRMGYMDRLVRVFKKTPATMTIDLDPIGSFVWNTIDDNRNIGDIAKDLQEHFGDEINPLYERLGLYINILRNNHWITLEKEVSHG